MVAAIASVSASVAPAAAKADVVAAQPSFFRQLLSELNPLQYVPVVGTIYRAVTGDTIPETARFAGSLVLSGLTGGPIGLAINVGATLLEHLFGIDPEKIGTQLLADLGIGAPPQDAGADAPATAPSFAGAASTLPPSAVPPSAVPPSAAPLPATPSSVSPGQDAAAAVPAATDSAPAAAKPWSSAQLAAYGISRDAGGTLTRGTMSGADVLNSLELARISNAPGGRAATFAAA